MIILIASPAISQKPDTSEIKIGNVKITIETDDDAQNYYKEAGRQAIERYSNTSIPF